MSVSHSPLPKAIGFRYVRRVRRSNKYQARVWISDDVGHVNLGLYETPEAAWSAAKAFINHGTIPTGVLPRWARLAAGGKWWMARSGRIVLGPFATAIAAHEGMRDYLKNHPRPSRKRKWRPREPITSPRILVPLIPAAVAELH